MQCAQGFNCMVLIVCKDVKRSTAKCSSQHKGSYVVPTRCSCTFQRRCMKCIGYSISRAMDCAGWSGKLAGTFACPLLPRLLPLRPYEESCLPVDSDEALVARIAVTAGEIWSIC
ncbi:hypothetical protein TNCV_1437001 [Trichonephila clavipes]|nr:hypothetical protein TNCV_1437001 [Trichonephila clavipes]